VVGRPEVVDRMKAAGEADERDQLQQNLTTLAHGMDGARAQQNPGATPKKVDLRRAGGAGAPANDHDGPPASGVARAYPPVEQEPHGEVQLDTGTGGPTPEALRNASRRDRGPSRQGGRFPDENPARERRADDRRKDQRRQERQPTPDTGRQWTLYYNPRRNLYGGRHPSDGDRHRGI
jgi:hypothetical protein